jgi:lysophospholipase L1-like esterase
VLLALVVSLVACTPDGAGSGATPAASDRAPSGPSTYLALGDSVAAGAGAPRGAGYVPLLAEALSARLGCDRTAPRGCPVATRNLARPGATTGSLLRDQLPTALQVLADTDVALVTVTVGGNDVFLPVLRACSATPSSASCRAQVRRQLDLVAVQLGQALSTLRAAAPGVPVAVMTYYDPVPACELAPLAPLSARVLEGDGDLLDEGLNDVLRRAAREVDAVVVETAARVGRDDVVGGQDCLHPNVNGHERLAQAFLDALGDRLPAERG